VAVRAALSVLALRRRNGASSVLGEMRELALPGRRSIGGLVADIAEWPTSCSRCAR